MGNIVGITFQQVRKYEKGENRIGSGRLYQFSLILKVPITYFFEGYGVCERSGSQIKNVTDAQYREIVDLSANLARIKDSNIKKYIKNLIEVLLKIDESQNQ